MRSMGHPDYVYQPHSDERRAKMSAAHQARLGVPPGHRLVCGVIFTEEVADRIETVLRRISTYPGSYELAHEAALRFQSAGVWALRPYMRDTPQWTRARIIRRRQRLIRQRQAEVAVQARIFRALNRREEAENRRRERDLMAEEDRIEHEQAAAR